MDQPIARSPPSDSESTLHAADSGYTLTGCQAFVASPHGSYGLVAGPAGVASWVRAETGKSEYPGYCDLSCLIPP